MDDDSLRRTRRTTRVHDAGNVFALRAPAFLHGLALPSLTYLFHREHANTRTSSLDLVNDITLRLPVVNHKLDGWGVLDHTRQCRQQVCVRKHTHAFGLIERVLET